MGAVFLARDTRLGRLVAIKFLAEESAASTERFYAEAQAIARCKHENIVVVHDLGEIDRRAYMVLEYIKGISLRTWLNERWSPHQERPYADLTESWPPTQLPVSVATTLEIIIPVVRALAHAHSQGIVHRDLKPENILLSEDGALKVVDFGIAKLMSPRAWTDHAHDINVDPANLIANRTDALTPGFKTQAGALLGTLPYMSPEQWGQGEIDPRSDIWAVGIILWELSTGQHPLSREFRDLLVVRNLERPMPSILNQRPDLGRLGQTVDDCLKKQKADRIPSAAQLLERLESCFAPDRPANVSMAQTNPYTGLAPFQEADATRFFGREPEIANLTARLRSQRMIAVVGPSGVGKSSFVRAGVIPALKRLEQAWQACVLRPGRTPFVALAKTLAAMTANQPPPSVSDDLIATEKQVKHYSTLLRTSPGYLGDFLRKYSRKHKTRILLFIDQFEELYTLRVAPEERADFLHCLDGVADDVSSPLRLVFTMRSDFIYRVTEDRNFSGDMVQGLILLPPLDRSALRQALQRPLEGTGYDFENHAMLDRALDRVQEARNPLPILQFTAAKLWEARDQTRRLLTEQSYDELGGVVGALASHADHVLYGFSGEDRQLTRRILTRLVTEEQTRTVVSQTELRALVPESRRDALERVVQELAHARLLSIETDDSGHAVVELSHESLIENWPRLKTWLEEDQEEAQFRVRLGMAAQEWDRRGRAEDLLWRGLLADEARLWQSRWQSSSKDRAHLGERDEAFLGAVLGRIVKTQRRHRYFLSGAFALMGLVITGVSMLATTARTEAIQARNATRMAVARENDADPTLVLALIREMEPAHLPARWSHLARWARQQTIARVVLEHPDAVYSAAFSPDGQKVITASFDKKVRVWNADGTGGPLVLEGHTGSVYLAAFSPNGTKIVTASDDKTARIWKLSAHDSKTALPPSSPETYVSSLILKGHTARVLSAAFSPDGQSIVTTSEDQTVRVWHASRPRVRFVLTGHTGAVWSAKFSPDGTKIATASSDKTVRIWNADGTGDPVVLQGHTDSVGSVSFHPDGKKIVTASSDKTIRIWRTDASGDPIVLLGHTHTVNTAMFSPDGTKIVTASEDKTARIWNADGTGNPIVLTGHAESVWTAMFSPDGKSVVTASFGKTARIWRLDTERSPVTLKGHTDSILSAAFDPSGQKIITASEDKTARIWNADGTGNPTVLPGHTDSVHAAVFSPDGTNIATASGDKTVRVWNADGTGAPRIFEGHTDVVRHVAFHPDGTRIVTASEDRTARIWHITGPPNPEPIVLQGHTHDVFYASFSPDGKKVVTASRDMTARVWNVDGTGEPVILTGHRDWVEAAIFSPDGRQVATVSDDKTLRLWNADGTGEARVISGHESVLGGWGGQRGFSPNGSQIVTISSDETVRIWHVNQQMPPVIIRLVDVDTYTVAFSPDGTRIVTTDHLIRMPALSPLPERVEHAAKVWRDIQPIHDLDDALLWTITTWCPSVALRMKLLSLSKSRAQTEYEWCRAKVARPPPSQ